ncbi:MAG: glyoxylase-like metal-dependent hydrolase (beta-lactamase superfamily II) [Cyclobacteriaceae bacterium]|jgi:glyoxylase-like metal-dependent hydrolase (beta-lactamase superfamily II)/rhodanese-related sulfurtransferase
MIVEQIYTGCLAEAAYYIESDGEVAIVDPLRETKPYLEKASSHNARIKYVLETHFHADFVSGHIDLARQGGAEIVFGPTATPDYPAYIATDEEELSLGKVTIRVLHTPGHTMESTSFLLLDEAGRPHALFSGDTLFIGDVGRPDLAVKSDVSREDLASFLFDSLRNKIMPLPDDVIVYPGHGAGSACGKNMSTETSDTLGNQKLFNYALQKDMTRGAFIREVTAGLVAPPQYFPKNAVINKSGYEPIEDVLSRGIVALDVKSFKSLVGENGALILDTRNSVEFIKSFVPGSLWIGIEDNFAPWVGALIKDLDQPIVFLADPGQEENVVTRLARVGYDHALGYLAGGIENWIQAGESTDRLISCNVEQFLLGMQEEEWQVMDVRKVSEFDSQHLEGAINIPLDFFEREVKKLNSRNKYFVHCFGGYRSLIASSILIAAGFYNIVNVNGGFKQIKQLTTKVTSYQEPVTML